MKYFPPERTQEQLDRAGAYHLPTHWDVLECLRSLANRMHGVAANAKDPQRRKKLLTFAAVITTMHDSLGLEDEVGITLDYFDKGQFKLGESNELKCSSCGFHPTDARCTCIDGCAACIACGVT